LRSFRTEVITSIKVVRVSVGACSHKRTLNDVILYMSLLTRMVSFDFETII